MKRISPFLVALIFLTSIVPLNTVVATGTSTTISTFSGGFATVDVLLSGGAGNNSTSFDVPRNVTFESANFEVEVDAFDTSPGQVWLDLNRDGDYEWDFSSTGYGNIGAQNTFYDGSQSATIATSNNSAFSPGIMIPNQATIKTSDLNTSFSPSLGGGFFQTGNYQDIAQSDIDNDGLPEPLFLSEHNATNISGNMSTGVSWIDWNQTNGMSTSPWIATCENASKIAVGDLNGDSEQDIVTFDIGKDLACIHIANNSGFDSPIEKILPMGLVQGELGDLNGDGLDDIISIHAMGVLSFAIWDNMSWNISTPTTTTLNPNGTPGMPSTLTSLEVGDFMNNGNITALICDATGYWQNWGYISGLLAGPLNNFDYILQDQIVIDVESDGDLDLIGANEQGYALLINNGTEWNPTLIQGQVDFYNSTIYDYDNDGTLELITPYSGTSDGNSATVEGNLSVLSVNSSGVGQTNLMDLKPWSMPQDITHMDMDGDGITEQIILSGETSNGLFIGGLHYLGLDINADGTYEAENFGYAGDGMNNLDPLQVVDQMNTISAQLNNLVATSNFTIDDYGIMMSNISIQVFSDGTGEFTISNMSLNYDCSFVVEVNPFAIGNLSNVINQGMTAGVGTYPIDLPFNSTNEGKITVTNLNAIHIPGAPNLSLPPAPTLTIGFISPQEVELSWDEITVFGDDLLRFEVFKLNSATDDVDFSNPYSEEMTNMFVDENVTVGSTYWYQVRSIHIFGVTSDLSNKLEVTIPYPAAPNQVQNVSLQDVPDDQGGALDLTWDIDDNFSVVIQHYEIYLETSTFTNVSGLTPIQNVTPTTDINSSVETISFSGLTNGQAYWAAVVAVDNHGNKTTEVVTDGPAYPRNDIPTSIDLGLNVTPVIGFGLPFELSLEPTVDGTSIVPYGGDIEVSISANGQSYLISSDWNGINLDNFSNLGAFTSNLNGEVTFFANYSGYIGDDQNRPMLGSSESVQRTLIVIVQFSADQESYTLDSWGETDVRVNMETYPWNAEASGLIEGAEVFWEISNQTSQNESNGTALINSNGFAQFSVNFPEGGTLYVNLSSPTWISTLEPEDSTLTIELYPYGHEEENNTENNNQTEEEEWEPTSMLQVILDCGQVIVDITIDNDITCTLTNPNNFTVQIGLDADGWSDAVELIEFNPTSPTSFQLLENESTQVEIRVDIIDSESVKGLQAGNIQVRITQQIVGWLSVPDTTFILDEQWALTGHEVIDTEEPDPVENNTNTGSSNAKSSDNSLTYILVGVGIAVAALIVFIIIRVRSEEEEDWTEEDLEMEDDPEISRTRASKPLPVGVALDEIEDRQIHDEAPDRDESELLREIDGIEEEEIEEYEIEYEEEDDGITVDEHGTEWYEDEIGVWWYRDEGEEDWSEFVEE